MRGNWGEMACQAIVLSTEGTSAGVQPDLEAALMWVEREPAEQGRSVGKHVKNTRWNQCFPLPFSWRSPKPRAFCPFSQGPVLEPGGKRRHRNHKLAAGPPPSILPPLYVCVYRLLSVHVFTIVHVSVQ